MPGRVGHIHGRGAVSAAVPQRFGLAARDADGDWRDVRQSVDGPVEKLRTTVTEERPRTILSFNASPDIPFDRSINAYRGCEHMFLAGVHEQRLAALKAAFATVH